MPITEAERLKRKGYIGSSDMAAILGFDKYRNAFDVFLDKTNRTEDSEPNEAMEAGTFFEAGVIDWAERKLGPVRRNIELILEQFHLIDHLDAQVIETGNPVEAKTTALFGPAIEEWGVEGSDELPDRILIQCHQHMICSEREICHVPAFIGGRGFKMYEVKKDNVVSDTILDKALDFWDCIESDEPPANIIPSVEFIKRIKRVPEKVVELDEKLVKEWQDAKDKVKWAEALLDDAKAAMLTALGDAEAGTFVMEGQSMMVTYFEQVSHLIDSKRLREEKPEIAKEYTKLSTCRIPRLKKIKKPFSIPKL
jgi:putative phage-type endonuclease